MNASQSSDELITRTMPHNRDIERAIIGAVLLDPREMETVCAGIPSDGFDSFKSVQPRKGPKPEPLFYYRPNQLIFSAILECYDRSETFDITIIAGKLHDAGLLVDVGGALYLSTLVDEVYSLQQVPEYVKILVAKWNARRLIRLMTSSLDSLLDKDTLFHEALDKIEKEVTHISRGTCRGEFSRIGYTSNEVWSEVERMRSGEIERIGLMTGFDGLDDYTQGIMPGDLFVIAGRPSAGKTALAMNIAANIAIDQKKTVAVFSLEMRKKSLTQRLLASEARVPLGTLKDPRRSGTDAIKAIERANQLLSSIPLMIDDTKGITIREIRSKSRQMKMAFPDLALIVIDYLTLIRSDTRFNEERHRVTDICHEVKDMAGELDVPVCLLAQLNRESEKQNRKIELQKPKLSDLKESGAIEEDADLVIFPHRESRAGDTAEIIIAKQRNGKTTGMNGIKIGFVCEQTRFYNLAKN